MKKNPENIQIQIPRKKIPKTFRNFDRTAKEIF